MLSENRSFLAVLNDIFITAPLQASIQEASRGIKNARVFFSYIFSVLMCNILVSFTANLARHLVRKFL